MSTFLLAVLAAAFALVAANQVLLAGLTAGVPATAAAQPAAALPGGQSALPPSATDQQKALQLKAQVIPAGTPPYGAAAGVSFDNVDGSLNTLVSYDQSIQLAGADLQRYIQVGTTKETACEFCCGIGENGFAQANGQLACACAHNIAFSGLTKWLIKNTDYTNGQIVGEIQKWKGLFFPGPKLGKELQKAGLSPTLLGLPAQQGGC